MWRNTLSYSGDLGHPEAVPLKC